MKRLVFVNSHPIQYFAPLYQYMAQDNEIDLEVWYCSRHGLAGEVDKQFGQAVKWDIPLLDGYRYEFIPNASIKPSIYTFWGLTNLALILRLIRQPKSLIVVHGWAYASMWIVSLFGSLIGHKICLRGENPLNQEAAKTSLTSKLWRVLVKSILFPFISHFGYIGEQNKAFYKYYGIPDHKLFFAPYSVDNARFNNAYMERKDKLYELKQRLGLPTDQLIYLFSGKYIDKKRPLDLLNAYQQLPIPRPALVFVGDGNLRTAMEAYIKEHHLNDVLLTGFVNQSSIVDYYAVADVYVMCSGSGETWGLSTNEAMNFHLPIVLSDTVGCAIDLLKEGQNGFRFKTGDIADLSQALLNVLALSIHNRARFGDESARLVANYGFESIVRGLKTIL
jgi:glycosyltransferase involved in cell wall biosynthesis